MIFDKKFAKSYIGGVYKANYLFSNIVMVWLIYVAILFTLSFTPCYHTLCLYHLRFESAFSVIEEVLIYKGKTYTRFIDTRQVYRHTTGMVFRHKTCICKWVFYRNKKRKQYDTNIKNANRLEFVPYGPIANIPILVQIMVWQQTEDITLTNNNIVDRCICTSPWPSGRCLVNGMHRYEKLLLLMM